jgi:hypothetical protein
MNDPQDRLWTNLVSLSGPAYAADGTPPYGFTTRMLARLHAEQHQNELMERIGLRAVFAAFAILLVIAAGAIGWTQTQHSDLEPGLGRIVESTNVPLS